MFKNSAVAEKFSFEKQSPATVRGLTQQLQKELELLRVSFFSLIFSHSNVFLSCLFDMSTNTLSLNRTQKGFGLD